MSLSLYIIFHLSTKSPADFQELGLLTCMERQRTEEESDAAAGKQNTPDPPPPPLFNFFAEVLKTSLSRCRLIQWLLWDLVLHLEQ